MGKEMFIITVGEVEVRKKSINQKLKMKANSLLQVVGGPNDSIIFVTLGAGVCCGEIALLGTGKMNRCKLFHVRT